MDKAKEVVIALAELADEAAAVMGRTDSLSASIKKAYEFVGEPGSHKRKKAVQ